ncbi:hypothetical protein [Streptomyces sp. TLI_171]|uniref:hypothetical protein n=1 Tax=Streptomyces sp. TLI_171 TaxID=1938859 RepID=UPI000C194B9F|nr:hypothetical protein [Streptomyces sp. TLI_171]RKE18976.1 hypothetical protein BX266_2275 [Streptomyces sp. TLI_171]
MKRSAGAAAAVLPETADRAVSGSCGPASFTAPDQDLAFAPVQPRGGAAETRRSGYAGKRQALHRQAAGRA